MSINRCILFYTLLSYAPTIFSQTCGVIYDKVTGNSIPYVNIWVENESIGTTSSSDGHFNFKEILKEKKLVISSIGYEKQIYLADSDFLEIFLMPITYNIPEIEIKPLKKQELKIGRYKRLQIIKYTAPTTPQIFARYFEFKDEYVKTPIIKALKIETLSKSNSIFNVRLFAVDEYGKPGKDILSTNMIVNAIPGRSSCLIEVNMVGGPVVFPHSGIFVGIEYLIIKQNEYSFTYKDRNTKETKTVLGYMPMFGIMKSKTESNSWVYREGMWKQDLGREVGEKGDDSYVIAIEIILSN